MREQAELDPEAFQQMLETQKFSPSGERVISFLNSYRGQKRVVEEPPNIAHDIRDRKVERVKMPRFAREEISNLQRKIISEEQFK